MFEKLKRKWSIDSNFQIVIIIIVFSITGSVAVYIAKPVLTFTGLNSENCNLWIYIPIRIFIIFPIYQIMILIIGAIFGQFKFFWNLQKKILRRMGFKNL